MKEVKIGLVGLGVLGTLHLAELQYKVPGARVIAICARTQETVKKMQEKFDVPYGYTEYDEMLKNPELNAVVIVSPVSYHKEHCIKAAEAGLHIFCEKPLAMTVEDCHAVERAVEKNKGKVFQLGFMRRSDPSYVEAKRRIDAGEIGDVVMYKGTCLDAASCLPYHMKGVETGKYAPFFYEAGSHDADMVNWYINSEVESVFSVGGAYVEQGLAEYNDYDNAMSLVRFKNGACALIHVGRMHNCNQVTSEIIGTKGTIRVNDTPKIDRLELFYGKEEGYERIPMEQTYQDRFRESFLIEKQTFIDCIHGLATPPSTVYDGAKSLRLVELMHRSYVERREVKADED